MAIIPDTPCPIHSLSYEWYRPFAARVDMLRLDLLHPVVSGNKWYKLKYNIEYAHKHGYKSVLTFGGAYSNHLVATAAAARAYGLRSIGIIRGLHAAGKLTPTLASCKEYGMELVFAERSEYGKKNNTDWLKQLAQQYKDAFIIPEGGANVQGRKGIADITLQIPDAYTHICVSVGSGTTMAGLRNNLECNKQVYGYVPMKQGRYMTTEIENMLDEDNDSNWQLFDDWHFGGFGKWNDELIAFMNSFYTIHHIPLDIVYTGKMMFGVKEQLTAGLFPADAQILCIHTGGLQGNTSVQDRLIY